MMHTGKMLDKKICLVTGCRKGVGKQIAETFAHEGAIVYANARQKACLNSWADEINAYSTGKIVPQYYDVTDHDAVKKAIMEIKRIENRLDVLVNNAAKMSNELFPMVRKKNMTELFEVNVYAVVDLTQLALKLMTKNGGSIINITSVVGIKGNAGQAIYSASKGAVIALTKSVAKEVAEKNIRVNAVAPGLTNTGALSIANPEELQKRIDKIGMKRLATPEDIANTCLYLASDLSEYVTGQIISVDGSAIM